MIPIYLQDETEDVQSLGRYVIKYIEDVMAHCKQYKNDLQASCLLAVIAVPVQLIQSLLAGIPPIMQVCQVRMYKYLKFQLVEYFLEFDDKF